MQRLLALFAGLFLCLSLSFGQEKYWIFFRDKAGVTFDPYHYFDQVAIEKRQRLGIPLVSYSDLPLVEDYCSQVAKIADPGIRSRWLNAVSVVASEEQLRKIRNFPFVKAIEPIIMASVESGKVSSKDIDPDYLYHLSLQSCSMGGPLFENKGLDGSGVRIAVFDGGFPGVDTLSVFRHLRDEGRIVATYDFVKKDSFVYDYSSHGTSVLACIGGKLDDKQFGLAVGAEFLLARTEVKAEKFAEEENWMAAMEWADREGADIINSSLGYTYHRYFPRQMDGNSTLVSKMASLAARKGMLVVNAAGNDGISDWKVIGAPADADSVLSVGGVGSFSGVHIAFSSFGPTYDGRMKPNVVAFGDVITTGKESVKKAFGTSFAAPLVTGFAACVMQMHPEWDNMKVFQEIEHSGHLYPYYDYAHGYGVPQASYFTDSKKEKEVPTFNVEAGSGFFQILFYPQTSERQDAICEDDERTNCEPEQDSVVYQLNEETAAVFSGKEKIGYTLDNQYFYYHFADKNTGRVRRYFLIDLEDAEEYTISLDNLRENEIVRIHHRGYTKTLIP